MSYNTSAHLRVWSKATLSTGLWNFEYSAEPMNSKIKRELVCSSVGEKRKSSTLEPLSQPGVWEPLEVGGMRGKLCLRNETQSSTRACVCMSVYSVRAQRRHLVEQSWQGSRQTIPHVWRTKWQICYSQVLLLISLSKKKKSHIQRLTICWWDGNISQTSVFLAHKTQISILKKSPVSY